MMTNKASRETLREALKPFAEIGAWLFARPLPDDTPVVEIKGLNGLAGALTRGHFKAAHAAFAALKADGQEAEQPLLKTVERILDDHSAWVAAPNKDVARAVAMAVGVVAQEMAKEIAMNLVDRAQKIFLQAIPNSEMVTSEDYNPIKAWMADATKFLKETQDR